MRPFKAAWALLFLLVCCAGAAAAPRNSVSIINRSGAEELNYPVQLGRPFVEGEVAPGKSVEARIDDRPLQTQVDVKQRWPDGSLKYAIVLFVVPKLPAGQPVEVVLHPAGAAAEAVPLRPAEMLDARFDFDATINVAGTSISAREMLSRGDFAYWTSGPVATTVILGDHSARRTYDVRASSFRPIFHATFWPAINKVRVRFIGENSLTTDIRDSRYDLMLSAGHARAQTFYEKRDVKHYAATRWTKEYWLGGEPARNVDVDYNLAYLSATRFVPNLEIAARAENSRAVAQYHSRWLKQPRDLYDAGLWTKYMPTTGGRDDIGLMPEWVARWIASGDARMREVALGSADLAAAWPVHYREGNAARKYDASGKIAAIGRPVSVVAWPTIWLVNNAGVPYFVKGDRITEQAYPHVSGGWIADGAHQPDPFSIAYVVTGDYWYLKELQFWAAAWALMYNPGFRPPGVARIDDQVRGDAWVFQNRVNAAFLSPDGTPEQAYFRTLVDQALAIWEGERDVHGRYSGSDLWSWARRNAVERSPLHFWGRGSTESRALANFVTPQVAATEPLWMNYYVMAVLGVAKEKGFATAPLLRWHSRLLTTQFGAKGYDSRLLAAYVTPMKRSNGTYFQTWEEIGNAYASVAKVNRSFDNSAYAIQAATAAAFVSGEESGADAWSWLSKNVRQARWYDPTANARWAVVPR
ncbi:MAG TPA: hypothetical protein VHP37_24520 [Burkholderiales bacterium]|nr:hypothetical protein [Burkholderiales bacterium]